MTFVSVNVVSTNFLIRESRAGPSIALVFEPLDPQREGVEEFLEMLARVFIGEPA